MKTILVCFPREETSDKIVLMLRQLRYPNVQKAVGVQQALRQMNQLQGGGVLITGHRLQGMSFERLLEIAPPWFDVILLMSDAKRLQGSWVNLLQLSPPINPKELQFAVNLCVAKIPRRGLSQEEGILLVPGAKEVLMKRFYLSEEQAHRFLQKKAMQNRVKRGDYAHFVLHSRVF